MITDKQIEVVTDVLCDWLPSSHKLFRDGGVRRALEAAEAAAWCDDIGQAPRDTFILAEIPPYEQPRNIARSSETGHWFGSSDWIGKDMAKARIKRWRHLPQPPKEDGK